MGESHQLVYGIYRQIKRVGRADERIFVVHFANRVCVRAVLFPALRQCCEGRGVPNYDLHNCITDN